MIRISTVLRVHTSFWPPRVAKQCGRTVKEQSIHEEHKNDRNGYQHTQVKCEEEQIGSGRVGISFCLCYLMPKCGHPLWAMKLILTIKGKAQINRIKFYLNRKWRVPMGYRGDIVLLERSQHSGKQCVRLKTHTQKTL